MSISDTALIVIDAQEYDSRMGIRPSMKANVISILSENGPE